MHRRLISLVVLTPLLTGLLRAQTPTVLESYDSPGYFLATTTSAGAVQMIRGANATPAGQWYVVPGLANPTGVSFQSVALADHFMRHRSFVLYADPRATDNLYLNDATFTMVPGLADATAVSFQSVNYPDRYLQHNATFGLVIEAPPANLGAATFRFPPQHPERATNPVPADEATDVVRETGLNWTPGQYAVSHDVYIGASLDDVNDASRADPLGVLAVQGHDANTFDPVGRFELGQTYYWRIDEVNALSAGGTIFKGNVWSFTVEPFSYAIPDVNATASSSAKEEAGPEKTIDGSGLNADDQHSTASADMWLSGPGSPQWIQYAFDKVYKLDKMWVWNSNQTLESLFGFGAKDVLVQYSSDGTTWTDLGNLIFNQAPGSADYVADIDVDFGGVPAKYVKLTISSNWGEIFQQYSLSEVRFFYIPVSAREPSPVAAATNVHPRGKMSWRAGREADSHEVYVGTDPNAVADSAAPTATTTQANCEVPLNLEETYYWKVVEVNQAETPSSWPSDLWSFSTATYITVDDFESYTNDSPKRVFQTWIDGGGFSPDDFFPNGHSGNGTGSFVGYDPTLGDIMETTYFYGPSQSMPLYYDNSAAPKISEAVRTLDPAKDTTDWTRHGLTTLVLFFRGDVNNVGAPLYVKINNTKVVYSNGAAATTSPFWKQWNIDLASVSVADLKNVKTLTIGIGDGSAGGTGTILVDEIRLYATAPQVAVPTDPGANSLEALYAMEGNVQDSSGKGRNGTATGDPGYVDGPAGFGKALAFDGINDYVDLSIGNLLSTLSGSTFATKVNFSNSGGDWQRIFDFGTGTNIYMFLTPRQGSNGAMRCAITTSSNAGEFGLDGPATLPSGWHHVAVVLDDAAMRIRLYMDGVEVGSNTTSLLPKDLGATTQNWLGRSQWSGDGYFIGSIDDFRIYSRVLSEGEIRYLAGDR
ncbi:MAG: hypothetical protein A2Y76_00720 [Planctomycetes bacterium RBG_13_60_9]|nr:MAG: hypothetical protein A2Y76_00720 [Planctomycetes bacterium RBG_13_60_9]